MENPLHHESAIELTISPDLLSASLDDAIALTCTITNHRILTFRMRKSWSFTQTNNPYGTLSCDILFDGKVYLDWQNQLREPKDQAFAPDDIVTLKQGESFTFDAALTEVYPLLHHGTYTLQAIFCPAELRGVRVSKCKPVYSNLVSIVVT